MIDLTGVPSWFLDKMQSPRGGFSPEERAAAQQQIKRRYALPASFKLPPKEKPAPGPSGCPGLGGLCGRNNITSCLAPVVITLVPGPLEAGAPQLTIDGA